MTVGDPLTVLEVDPSLFTAPYDAALTDGLVAAGLDVIWATRPLRPGESDEFRCGRIERHFYRGVDRNSWIPTRLRGPAKGLAHLFGLVALVSGVWRRRIDIVHFQWAVVPVLDALAIRMLRRWVPVVITVHDATPFNGDSFSRFQSNGFDTVIRLADHAVVHTRSAEATLLARGHDPARLSIVPHGPLGLKATPSAAAGRRNPRWTFVLFGQLKPYKGLALLVEACAALPSGVRQDLRVVVAGEAQMDLGPVRARIAEADLADIFELRLGRLSEQEMSDLFAEADAFVFPYGQIDASGVYYLVKGEGKWIVATRVGIFAEDVADGQSGRLVEPGDIAGLAAALTEASERRAIPAANVTDTSWTTIGWITRRLYEDLLAAHRHGARR